jgi:DNA-directed RNA polymerase specialized sigma24 family protein
VEASTAHVYGAAVAAAADREAAAVITRTVMVAAATGRSDADARSLVERAVLTAVRTEPDPAFAPMREEDREVVALARVAGYTVAEVAAALDIPTDEAQERMTSGVRALAAAVS